MRTLQSILLTALLTSIAAAAPVLVVTPAPLTGNNGVAGWGFTLINDTSSYLSIDSIYLASPVDHPEYRFGADARFTGLFSNIQAQAQTILIGPNSTFTMPWNGSDQGLATWDFPDGYRTFGDFESSVFGIAVNYSLWDDNAYSTPTLDANQEAVVGTLQADAQLRFINNAVPVTPSSTIASSPAGQSFTVTGEGCSPGSYVAPQTFTWIPESNCNVSFTTPEPDSGPTRYQFGSWEDESTSPSRDITVGTTPATYLATFETQHMLTTTAGIGGTVSPGGYFYAGTNATITATPAGGFALTNFTGAVTSTTNPISLLMDAPKSITANFSSIGAPLLTAAISSKADGTLPNERIWTLQVTNTGAGAITNVRVASVQILAANPTGNLGLISLGSTAYPAAVANPALSPGQSSTVPVRVIFPATSPATRIQFRINLAGDNGYTNSVTLSNVVR